VWYQFTGYAAWSIAVGLFCVVVPFIFRFTDDTAATAYFILIGVGFLLLTIATRYRDA